MNDQIIQRIQMGSKVNNYEEGRACGKSTTDSEALRRHQKSQILQQNQEIQGKIEMIPSISNHRCSPNPRMSPSNPRTSPSCLKKKKIGSPKQDSLPSTLIKDVDLSSLVSMVVNNNYIQNGNENTSLQFNHQDGLHPLTLVELETIREFVSAAGVSNQEERNFTACEYDETFGPMIIDAGDDAQNEDCASTYEFDNMQSATILSFPLPSTNEESVKPFCASRMPQRSSMKGSEKPSPLSQKRAKAGSSGTVHQNFLPGQMEPIERHRSITYSDEIDIQLIEPIRLLADNGPQSLWYQEFEYETIKLKTLALLDRVDHSSGVIEGKKYCTRGLEKFMTPETTEVKKHQAWDSVLNEQFLQRQDGEFDEEAIANIYHCSTKRSKREAEKRAILDQQAAESYLKTSFRAPELESHAIYDRRVSM